MITITKAKYQSEDSNWISLTFDDDSIGSVSTTDGIRRKYTDLYNEYVENGGVTEPYKTAEELLVDKQAKDKTEANQAIQVMTVTTHSGKEFDAHQEARINMMSAILGSEITGQTETVWRLYDHAEVVVSVDELKEATVLALRKFGELKNIGG